MLSSGALRRHVPFSEEFASLALGEVPIDQKIGMLSNQSMIGER